MKSEKKHKEKVTLITGHLKLLKAEFLYRQAQFKKSQKLISKVRKISKSQSMEYLEDAAKPLLPEITR